MLSVYILSCVCLRCCKFSRLSFWNIWGCMFAVYPPEHKYLREYITTPSYYHHQIGSIHLCAFPIIVIFSVVLCLWWLYIIFCQFCCTPLPFPGKLGCVTILFNTVHYMMFGWWFRTCWPYGRTQLSSILYHHTFIIWRTGLKHRLDQARVFIGGSQMFSISTNVQVCGVFSSPSGWPSLFLRPRTSAFPPVNMNYKYDLFNTIVWG